MVPIALEKNRNSTGFLEERDQPKTYGVFPMNQEDLYRISGDFEQLSDWPP